MLKPFGDFVRSVEKAYAQRYQQVTTEITPLVIFGDRVHSDPYLLTFLYHAYQAALGGVMLDRVVEDLAARIGDPQLPANPYQQDQANKELQELSNGKK